MVTREQLQQLQNEVNEVSHILQLNGEPNLM